jgi:hypothetical protein
MRTLWLIGSIFFIGCSRIKTPQIEFKEIEYDFGDIAEVTEVTHIFKFKNVGGDTLIINKIQAP